MNPFRRKAKDADASSSHESQARTMPSLSGRTFRRTKKQPESKPEVNIAAALPSTDQFRTSLLMPNLSARFSMLREQDDPFSLIGKASDDSVLHKRFSKFGELADIAEASSLRPPFAKGRTGSTASGDGYGTDDESMFNGSIMSRSRPGEGNNLFGGRQKIYKIPASGSGSTKDLNASGARFLYEHDVHQSAFQVFRDRQRLEEQELRLSDRPQEPTELVQDGGPRSRPRPDSPLRQELDRRRETTSSTASAPSNDRSSTAATSIASQGTGSVMPATTTTTTTTTTSTAAAPAGRTARAPSKSRRLYEHGLDQHMHEQQSSALSRLDQLARQRLAGATSPPPGPRLPLSHAGSLPSLRDAAERPNLTSSTSASRRPLSPTSPPAPAPAPAPAWTEKPQQGRDPVSGEPRSNAPSPMLAHVQSPPVSPVGSEDEEAMSLEGAIRARDRGKATAGGMFSRPQRPYDDDQYSQRQRQMQQHGSMTPPLRRVSPPGVSASPSADRRPSTLARDSTSRPGSEASLARRPSGPARPAVDVSAPATGSTPGTPGLIKQGTFLAPLSDAGSDVDSEAEGERLLGVGTGLSSRPGPITPAEPTAPPMQPSHTGRVEGQELRGAFSAGVDATHAPYVLEPAPLFSKSPKIEQPADPAVDLRDLRVLVRQHLRSESNQSATPAPTASFADQYLPADDRLQIGRAMSPEAAPVPSVGRSDTDASVANGATLEKMPSPDMGTREFPAEKRPEVTPAQAIANGVAAAANQHTRNPSLETRQRLEFANELAERRRKVQENLKSFAESVVSVSDSSNSVPKSSKVEQKRLSPLRTSPTLGILTPKSAPLSTQPSPAPAKSDISSKAMKMLSVAGTDAAPMVAPSVVARDGVAEPDQTQGSGPTSPPIPDVVPSNVSSPKPTRNWGQIRRDARRELEKRQRETKEAERHANKTKTPSPPSSSGSGRNRSGSDLSARLRLASGLFKHDSQQASSRIPKPTSGGADVPSSTSRSQRVPLPELVRPRSPRQSSGRGALDPGRSMHASLGHRRSPAPSPTHIGLAAKYSPRPSPDLPPSPKDARFPGESSPPPSSDGSSKEHQPSAGTVPAHRKRIVQKSAISEPTLVSCTSEISAVDLAEASHSRVGGNDLLPPLHPPPLPPLNPRRRTRFPGADGNPDGSESVPPSGSSSEATSPLADPLAPLHQQRSHPASSENLAALGSGQRSRTLVSPLPPRSPFPHDRTQASPLVPPVNGAMF
ncbi:MAG: hypothetical protein M1815_002523 [Lichina confinis]|nr:MAG: hypothetical protein M1815_002523 [Lichina confinis]